MYVTCTIFRVGPVSADVHNDKQSDVKAILDQPELKAVEMMRVQVWDIYLCMMYLYGVSFPVISLSLDSLSYSCKVTQAYCPSRLIDVRL